LPFSSFLNDCTSTEAQEELGKLSAPQLNPSQTSEPHTSVPRSAFSLSNQW
jgi:hypothetical protein